MYYAKVDSLLQGSEQKVISSTPWLVRHCVKELTIKILFYEW